MATVTIKEPSVIVLEYMQEKTDADYGSCLWARFYFDTEKYSLSIQSDCGSYNYNGWTPTPNKESFLGLLSRLDRGYLLDKISSKCCIDSNKTFANMKNLIAKCFDIYGDDNFEEAVNCGLIDELIIEEIESACFADTQECVVEGIMAATDDLNDYNDSSNFVNIELYDIYYNIETDYPENAKKIVSVFADFIQPKIKEILIKK